MTEAGLNIAASLAFNGINPFDFLRTNDPMEVKIWELLQEKLVKLREVDMHNQAVLIAKHVLENIH